MADSAYWQTIKRKRMKEAGAFDGRFRTRKGPDKSKYKRKKKHKNEPNDTY